MTLPIQRIREVLSPTYAVDRELGRGGMATVYSGLDTVLRRRVAIKELRPQFASL